MATRKTTRRASKAPPFREHVQPPTPTSTTRSKPKGPLYVLAQGGPTLFNLRVNKPEVRFYVNGPGMLFDCLRLLTSIGAYSGATAAAFQLLAREIEIHVFCGHAGDSHPTPILSSSRIGARLEFPVGPMGMYQSELVLKTRSGESFDKLLTRAFNLHAREDFIAALEPIAAKGHAEHHPHHAPAFFSQVDPPDTGHSHRPGPHSGHHH